MINIVPSSRAYGPYCYKVKLYDIIYWGNLVNPYTYPGSLRDSDWEFMLTDCEVCQYKATLLNKQIKLVEDPLSLDFNNPKFFGPDHYSLQKVYDIMRTMNRYHYNKVKEDI